MLSPGFKFCLGPLLLGSGPSPLLWPTFSVEGLCTPALPSPGFCNPLGFTCLTLDTHPTVKRKGRGPPGLGRFLGPRLSSRKVQSGPQACKEEAGCRSGYLIHTGRWFRDGHRRLHSSVSFLSSPQPLKRWPPSLSQHTKGPDLFSQGRCKHRSSMQQAPRDPSGYLTLSLTGNHG